MAEISLRRQPWPSLQPSYKNISTRTSSSAILLPKAFVHGHKRTFWYTTSPAQHRHKSYSGNLENQGWQQLIYTHNSSAAFLGYKLKSLNISYLIGFKASVQPNPPAKVVENLPRIRHMTALMLGFFSPAHSRRLCVNSAISLTSTNSTRKLKDSIVILLAREIGNPT